MWRSVRLASAELTARCWSNQNRAESLTREDRNGEVEKGQSSLRNFSATRGASAPIPCTWRSNRLGLLFATGHGTPWDADLVRKRKLYPLLKKLGIERCGFHAFRHGNETVMDGEGVPMATRQNRLGHSDARTTMRYTHVISEDGRKIATRFGELLTCSPTAAIMPAGNE